MLLYKHLNQFWASMLKTFLNRHHFALKWIGIAFVIKIPLFAFFSFQFIQNWPVEKIVKSIFIELADSSGYYDPLEHFINGSGYDSFCRMPGLLPIYVILRCFFSIAWTKVFIIVTQFIAGTISVYALASIAKNTFGSMLSFKFTFYTYAFSTFVSIWDHCGGSDSLAVSFLILSIFFVQRFIASQNYLDLLIGGVFIAWSVFFRPFHGILVPIISIIYLLKYNRISRSLLFLILFGAPLALSLGCWTIKNYIDTRRLIFLQGPAVECFGSVTTEILAVRSLIEAWGGDIQPWAPNSAGMWFFEKSSIQKNLAFPENNVLTTNYNIDSLVLLRKQFHHLSLPFIGANERELLKKEIVRKSELYKRSYIEEKPINFYLINRLKLLKTFLFRNTLDNLPFPNYTKMAFYHKIIKGGYFLLLLSVNFFGFIGCIFALSEKRYLALVPLSIIIVLGPALGFIEQRYLAPAYPFLIIFSSIPIFWLLTKFQYLRASVFK